jgi:L-amino acid N-acyltransferase YncA
LPEAGTAGDGRILAMSAAETSPKLTIRPAQDADAGALREIFNEALEDRLATFAAAPRSLEEQKELIAAAARDLRYPILVAEIRGWPSGFVALEPHDERHHLDDMGEVVIFVRRSFRSYGVGRELMRMAQTEAARLGYRKLIGFLLAENHDGIRLCQATGWHSVGIHQKHSRNGNRLRDVVVVEYQVPPAASPKQE